MASSPCIEPGFDLYFPMSQNPSKPVGRGLSQVPEDVFTMIIELVMASHSIKVYHESLKALRLVCKSWDSSIIHTTSLWAVITNTDQRPVIQEALMRSREHPLTIWFVEQTIAHRISSLFPLLLANHSHRWIALRLELIDDISFVQEFLHNPTPELRFLSIEMLHEDPNGPRTTLVASETSSLTHARARYCLLAKDVISFRSVRCLEIAHHGNWPHLKIMLETLEGLEDLVLQRYPREVESDDDEDEDEDKEPFEKTPRLTLPNLRRLSILGFPAHVIEDIAGNIETTKLCHFALIVTIDVGKDINSSIPSLQPFLSSAVRNGLQLPKFLSLGRELISWVGQQSHNPEEVGGIQVCTAGTVETIRWMAELMAVAGKTEPIDVNVRLGFGSRTKAMDVLRALTTFRHVHKLDLLDRVVPQGAGGLQEWLKWLTPISKPGSPVPLPLMYQLSIGTAPQNDVMDVLRACIRARIISSSPSDLVTGQRGIPLKRIIIHDGKLKSVILREIQEVLGPDSNVVLPDGRLLSTAEDDDPVFHQQSVPKVPSSYNTPVDVTNYPGSIL